MQLVSGLVGLLRFNSGQLNHCRFFVRRLLPSIQEEAKMLRTPQQIREDIANRNAEVDAVVALAKEDNRDLTADETKLVNIWHGEGDEGGDFAKLENELKQAEKIEARKKKFLNSLTPDQHQQDQRDPGRQSTKIVVPAKAKRHGVLKAYQGDDAEKDAYVAGHFYAAQIFNSLASRRWLDEHGISNALSEGDNDRGGIFVPVETETAIIRLVENYGVFRRFASIEPMGSDRKVVPVRVAGLTAYPVAETNTANQASNTGTESTPQYKNIELVARKWKTITRMSDELDEDSLISMADQLSLEIALAFAIAEDQAGFLGDGTSTYHNIKGLANALLAGSVHTAATGNTAFSTLDAEDFEAMVGKLPDYPGIQPAWHVTKEGYYASMYRLKRASGGTTGTEMAMGFDAEFMGYPVIFNQVTNKTLTAQTDTRLLYFGDLNMAVKMGNRRGVTVSRSDERYWDVDQIGVKGTERFDIVVHSVGTADDPGAIIAMDTPSS